MATKPADWTDTEEVGEEVDSTAPAPVGASAPTPVTVAPAPSTVKPAAAPVAVVDDFPTDYKSALKLRIELQKFARIGDKPTPEQKANHFKYLRLCKHVHTMEQGLPHLHTDATHKGAFAGLVVSDRTRFEHLAKTDLTGKKLLAAHDALAKQVVLLQNELEAHKELLEKA